MNVTVDVINDSTCQDCPDPRQFTEWCQSAANMLQASGIALPDADTLTLCIQIVDAERGAQLNQHYRQKNYPTNVLSFASDLPPAVTELLEEVPLGDLVICADVVLREAIEQHKSALAHWAHMTVHGLLHLCGLDHQNDSDAEFMESLESRILATSGFENPYIDRSIPPA